MNHGVYTKEIWEKCNKVNKDLLHDYLLELKTRKRKESTLSIYLSDGRMIMCYIYLYKDNRSILTFKKKDFRDLTIWLQDERNVSNARFNGIYALIHGMLDFAEDEEDTYEYERNYSRKIKKLPREPKREITFLTDEQIYKLRQKLLEDKLYRECAYLDIMYDSTSRIGEIHQIKKESVIDSNLSNTVVAKRGKKRQNLLNERSKESVRLYLEQRGEDKFESLWVTSTKKLEKRRELSKGGLHDMCKKMSKILSKLEGKEIDFSSHSLRHSALENYKKGTHYMCKVLATPRKFSLEELQLLAGHTNISTTMSYLKPRDIEDIQSMFNIQ